MAGLLNQQNVRNAALSKVTFSQRTTLSLPGYFKSRRGGTAFYWKQLKVKHRRGSVLVVGNFAKPAVFYALPSGTGKLSDDRRSMTFKFKIANSKGRPSGKTGHLVLKKLGKKSYQVNLSAAKGGRDSRAFDVAGRFEAVAHSPAQSLFDRYAKKKLAKQYHRDYNHGIYREYKKERKAGKLVKNPKKDPTVQAKIRSKVKQDLHKDRTTITKEFNYDFSK